MLDFFKVSTRCPKRGQIEIYPKFIVRSSQDLMIRGGDFYAVWNEDENLWSTSEEVALFLIDRELDKFANDYKNSEDNVKVLHMWDAESGMIDRWHKYVQKQMRDKYYPLDEKLIFANSDTSKSDYASKKLPYPLAEGPIDAWDELMGTLYSEDERHKIEWAIGAIVSGDSKKIQKFMVMYGAPGTGKSTVINVIQDLFQGYYSVFEAKVLGQSNNAFALEAFKSNPLVAIEHDGDLSRIEDNTRLNSIVSHEYMTVNEKFKSTYTNKFNCFLFMGTNKPVKISDAKSGILRRLIDVSPTGKKIPQKRYKEIINLIKFELGAIAYHCLGVYTDEKEAYDDYIPVSMLGASNDFYNFVLEEYENFKRDNGVTLKVAWERYKQYCDDANVPYPYPQRIFKEELKNYFEDFKERDKLDGEVRVRNYYSGFITTKFEYEPSSKKNEKPKVISPTIIFEYQPSIFDVLYGEYPAQLATKEETPSKKWENVKTTLSDIDTSELHYIRIPENHIVIDFDIPDENGNKSYEKNLEAASKWPVTYAELSKSGAGIHLHYIYDGDASKLSRVFDDHIEIKVFTGNSSLRRKLTKCNNKPIATISSGLPMKGENKMVNFDGIKSEKALRTLIKKNLNKEYHANTRPSMDFIYKNITDAYESGMTYDISDMRPAIMAFAANSTHQSDYCLKLVKKMQFKSDIEPEQTAYDDDTIVFYDIEVFPNLFLVNWKKAGADSKVIRMINPTAEEIENLVRFKLVGFNCRRYDNHVMYARMLGYSNEELYQLSQRIINGSSNCFFSEAYNLSYTDVYDFSAKKQSLKKWEIELGIHHQELGLPWDKPVPEDMWYKVAEYCDNDVIATEAVFDHLKGDFTARLILADVAGLTPNDTTNSLTTRIIFGTNRKPQGQFNYRNLADKCKDKPYFEGYKFERGVSTYKGYEVGEGGFVWAKPGMYGRAMTFDVASMHPSSVIAENLFGEYTQRFKDILDARIAIKHKDFDKAKTMLNGSLAKYLDDPSQAKALAQALKIAINSVYGLTAAKFDNSFRDPRNIDNIVAKRGALFMINLKEEVEARGGEVIHIKTDSIKILDPSPEIQEFVMEYGKSYGYTFEVEHIFEKICLVNDAVYVAKLAADDPEEPGQWTATGTQFAVPYVFKTLFTKEPIIFSDLCETKSVSSTLYLDFNESLPDDEHDYRFIGKVGSFCPIKPGCGGGVLLRDKGDGTYAAATGSKGYRWMEAEVVDTAELHDLIDKSYYQILVDKAVDTMSKYGDVEWFIESMVNEGGDAA